MRYATNVANARDLPGKCRASQETGRFKTRARKNEIATITNGPCANQTNPITPAKPKMTNQNLINVPVSTVTFVSFIAHIVKHWGRKV